MSEFDLSNKIVKRFWSSKRGYRSMIDEGNVKEFIRLESDLMNRFILKEITWNKFVEERNKLMGNKFVSSQKEVK